MANKPLNVTLESLRAVHKGNAEAVFQEIAMLGGFGQIKADYAGGLDIGGITDESVRSAIMDIITPKAPAKDSPKGEK